MYRIRPYYPTVRLGFSKLLGKLLVKYVSTDTKGMLKQRSTKDSSKDAYAMALFVCVEVLWPSQPNGVMSSAVSLPNHTFTGQV